MLYPCLLAVHILSALVWGGGGMLTGFFVLPAMQAAGPGQGLVMAGMMRRKFGVWMGMFSVLAIATGLTLFILRAYNSAGWAWSSQGLCLGLGGLLGLGAWVMGLMTLKPQSERIASIIEGAQLKGESLSDRQKADIAFAQLRMARVGRIAAWHLLVATVLMIAQSFLS